MDLIQTLDCTQSVFWGIIIIDTLHRELIYPEVNMEDTLTEMFSLFFFFFLFHLTPQHQDTKLQFH